MALSSEVAGTLALAPVVETVDTGAAGENRQYQHILAVAASQELRLTRHAALRKRPGYDLSDPWLVPGEADVAAAGAGGASGSAAAAKAAFGRLVPGMPCRLVGGGADEVVAFLGLADGADAGGGMCRVRRADGKVATHASRFLLPMPTRPARQGDWALAVDLKGQHEHLNGRRGMCGLCGLLAGGNQGADLPGLWVMFEPTDRAAAPEMVLLEERNLVALPTPPPGAARTPWEARASPRAALPSGSEPKLLALVDEGRREEERLAIVVAGGAQDEDSASDAGSIELGESNGEEGEGDGDEEEGEEGEGARRPADFLPSAGDLVAVAAAETSQKQRRRQRFGIVARVEGAAGGAGAAWVRLLPQAGCGPDEAADGKDVELPIAALSPAGERELVLGAACGGCGSAEPEAELLMCENFGKKCLSAAHLSCLSPPLKAVPKGAWYCDLCGGSRRLVAAASAADGGGATAADGGGGSSGSGGPPPAKRAKAEAKPKAKAASAAAKAPPRLKQQPKPKRK